MILLKTLMMLAAAMLFTCVAAAQTPVEFDFTSAGAPALNGIGTSYTVDGITLSADAEGPEFADGQPTGQTIALNTFISDIVGGGRLVIDNQTVTDSEFEDFTENSSGTDDNEDAFISSDETLTLSFDTAVEVTSIDFFSIDDEEVVTVAFGVVDSFEFSTVLGDVFENPFGTIVIPAGTDLTFSIGGSTPNNAVRFGLTNIEVVESTRTPVLLGDANCDNVVNFLDITPFIGFLTSGDFKVQADVNRDGSITFLDITPFIAILANTGL